MTNDQIKRAKKLCKLASYPYEVCSKAVDIGLKPNGQTIYLNKFGDAEFIAESRTLLPLAIAEIERLREGLRNIALNVEFAIKSDENWKEVYEQKRDMAEALLEDKK